MTFKNCTSTDHLQGLRFRTVNDLLSGRVNVHKKPTYLHMYSLLLTAPPDHCHRLACTLTSRCSSRSREIRLILHTILPSVRVGKLPQPVVARAHAT